MLRTEPAQGMQGTEEIRGNTLRVYVQLLKRGPSELRDVQRSLGLSTPSLASYHLGRLSRAGYVAQDQYGRYMVTGKPPAEILAGYSKVGTTIVPQLFFFSLLFSILVAFFSYEVLSNGSFVVFLVAVSIAAVLSLWYETARLWQKLVS